jgi:large subunit ribosomal protein L10
MNRAQKERDVAKLAEKFKRANIGILTDYQGLNVEQITDLRRKLRGAQAEYRVVKNTLMRRAAKDTGIEPLLEKVQGTCAVALSYADPVAAAKVLIDFAAKQDKLKIKIGVLQGRLLQVAEVEQLAKIPPREVLLAQLLGVLVAVPTSLVRVLNAVPAKMVYALAAIRDEKEKSA